MSDGHQSLPMDERGLVSKGSLKDTNHRPLAKRRCVSPSRHPYIQKNLDIFKETFQKPSQIYKFLKESWKTNPLYLNRTLSYISKHRSRTIKTKAEKDFDLIIARLAQNQSICKQENVSLDQTNGAAQNGVNGISGINCDNSNTVIEKNSQPSETSSLGNICYFNWICDDKAKTSQKTRSYGFICPWCEKDYNFLDSLMAHLKCCHPRFNFNLVEEDNQSVIEMTLNLSFDGSYCGFKYPGHDLRRDFRFTPTCPLRRMPITQILHFRAKKRTSDSNNLLKPKSTANGDMFSYDEGEADVDVCSGRLYYHTSTCLPIKPNEVDIDSEADIDPEWLRERTQLMIDEFTDVNEGEKEILKLWNLHIMKNYKYKGDNMIPQACLDFVESEGLTVLSNNLSKNFTLHLANLFDFGLISSQDLLDCIRQLNKLKLSEPNSPSKTTCKIKSERSSNEHCQNSSPAKRALINSHCNQ